ERNCRHPACVAAILDAAGRASAVQCAQDRDGDPPRDVGSNCSPAATSPTSRSVSSRWNGMLRYGLQRQHSTAWRTTLLRVGGPMKNDLPSAPSSPSRRNFLVATGGTAVAAVVAACASTATPDSGASATQRGQDIEGAVPITLRINGKDHELRIDPRTTLL